MGRTGTVNPTGVIDPVVLDDATLSRVTLHNLGIIEEHNLGLGDLIKIAAINGKKQNKKIKLGICGEHGGDPKSIDFCSKTGLDYVSCSPYRVPVARLAAAQAQLKKN